MFLEEIYLLLCLSCVCVTAERNEWLSVLQEIINSSRLKSSSELTLNPCVTSEMKGYLELRGLRSKLYTIVCGDKVFLYKNAEVINININSNCNSVFGVL